MKRQQSNETQDTANDLRRRMMHYRAKAAGLTNIIGLALQMADEEVSPGAKAMLRAAVEPKETEP